MLLYWSYLFIYLFIHFYQYYNYYLFILPIHLSIYLLLYLFILFLSSFINPSFLFVFFVTHMSICWWYRFSGMFLSVLYVKLLFFHYVKLNKQIVKKTKNKTKQWVVLSAPSKGSGTTTSCVDHSQVGICL